MGVWSGWCMVNLAQRWCASIIVHRHSLRHPVAEGTSLPAPSGAILAPPRQRGRAMEQQIRFCTSADGTRIAYATYGERPGTPLVVVSSWPFSQRTEWESPHSRAEYEHLAQGRPFVTFDRRGVGASQREVDDFSLDAQ